MLDGDLSLTFFRFPSIVEPIPDLLDKGECLRVIQISLTNLLSQRHPLLYISIGEETVRSKSPYGC